MNEIRLLAGHTGPHCVILDEQELAAATAPALFGQVAVDLCGEFATALAYLAGTEHQSASARDAGILRGLAVRAVKLLDRLVAESTEHHGEMQMLYERLLLETHVNLGYLLKDDENFDQSVGDALVTPRKRRAEIERRMGAAGDASPIERRQLKAIESQFDLGGVGESSKRLPAVEQRLRIVYGARTRICTMTSGSVLAQIRCMAPLRICSIATFRAKTSHLSWNGAKRTPIRCWPPSCRGLRSPPNMRST